MSEISKGNIEQTKQKGLSIDIINNEYLKLDNYRKKYGIDEETNLLIDLFKIKKTNENSIKHKLIQ